MLDLKWSFHLMDMREWKKGGCEPQRERENTTGMMSRKQNRKCKQNTKIKEYGRITDLNKLNSKKAVFSCCCVTTWDLNSIFSFVLPNQWNSSLRIGVRYFSKVQPTNTPTHSATHTHSADASLLLRLTNVTLTEEKLSSIDLANRERSNTSTININRSMEP